MQGGQGSVVLVASMRLAWCRWAFGSHLGVVRRPPTLFALIAAKYPMS